MTKTFSVVVVLLGLALSACAQTPKYPEHWWAPISRDGAPNWEILPQEAASGEVILSKRNELGLLSNFSRTPFEFRGKHYESVEGLWQMMLYPEGKADPRNRAGVRWDHTREEVAQMVAFEAKAAGGAAEKNMIKLGVDWVSFEGERFVYRTPEKGRHFQIIREAMTEKFKQNPRVREVLMATGTLVLKPDHHQEPDAPPAWRYNEIWMEIRNLAKSGRL